MVWKEIKGYEGRYMVSDTGKIMSLPRTIKTSRDYGSGTRIPSESVFV